MTRQQGINRTHFVAQKFRLASLIGKHALLLGAFQQCWFIFEAVNWTCKVGSDLLPDGNPLLMKLLCFRFRLVLVITGGIFNI